MGRVIYLALPILFICSIRHRFRLNYIDQNHSFQPFSQIQVDNIYITSWQIQGKYFSRFELLESVSPIKHNGILASFILQLTLFKKTGLKSNF